MFIKQQHRGRIMQASSLRKNSATPMIEEKKHISRTTAQKRLGCTKKELRDLMENGSIAFSRKESGGFLIDAASVNDYIARRACNNNTALYNRIRQLEARVELMEDLLERNGIQIPDALQQPAPKNRLSRASTRICMSCPFLAVLFLSSAKVESRLWSSWPVCVPAT